jgi:hypothetical protein
MTSKKFGLGALCIAAIAAFTFVSDLTVNAQSSGNPKAGQVTETATAKAAGLKDGVTIPSGNKVTLTGRVVDFHCFMTGVMPSADAAKCTADCIRAGVPIGLHTSEGLIVLGKGIKGPEKALLPFAYQIVEVRGTLFESGSVRYLDISSIQASDESHDESN